MKNAHFLFFVLCLLFLIPQAGAAIVSIPLDCTGNYPNGAIWSLELNLGQQFSAINSISIDWSGFVTSETYYDLNGLYFGPTLVLPGAFIADIHVPTYGLGQAISDETQSRQLYNNPLEPFSGTDLFSLNASDIQTILAGPVMLTIHPGGVGTIILTYTPYDPSDGIIQTAVLLVDGTPIPEPATLLLLGLGGLALRKRR